MVMPDDFMAELRRNPAAKDFFETLDRTAQYTICHRLQTIKRAENRKKAIATFVDGLARGAPFR